MFSKVILYIHTHRYLSTGKYFVVVCVYVHISFLNLVLGHVNPSLTSSQFVCFFKQLYGLK